MADIDRLEVEIEASAAKANQALESLIKKLEKVSGTLSGIHSGDLTAFANGVERLGRSMQAVSSVKTTDFTRLAKGLNKLTGVDVQGVSNASRAISTLAANLSQINTITVDGQGFVNLANAIGNLGRKTVTQAVANIPQLTKGIQNLVTGLNSIGAINFDMAGMANLVSSITKLGGKSATNAIPNIQQLGTALKGLMTTLSTAPTVSQNLISMTNALANLASNGSRVSSATSSLNNGLKSYSSTARTAEKRTFSLAAAFGKFYANFFMIVRGVKKLGQAVESAMNYVETYNYFGVTMDKIGTEYADMYEQFGYDSAKAYADSFTSRMNELTRKMTGYNVGSNGELNLTDSIGLALDPEAIMNYQSSIAAVTNSVGLLGENSVNVSKALTMLSADMSSLKNVDLSTAMTNFQSGLIGQSRALYKYGIDITNATLQTYAYNLGLSKSVSEMTQAEKMQLRMIAILDQSKVAWADQANTINSVANQYRIMKQQISNLARVIGNLFLPIVQKVLPVVNGLIIALQRLFTALGFKLWGGNWLKDTMDGISGGYADDSLGDLEDDADNAADGLNNTKKAADKLKATLLGFDQINKLNDATDSSSASGSSDGSGGTIDLSDAIGAAVADYESIWDKALADSQNKAQEYADAITEMFTKVWNAIEPFRNAIVNLWDNGLAKLANFAWTGLKDFYEQFLVPIGTWAFGTEDAGLTRLVNIINNGFMAIHWEDLSASLKNFWAAIEPYAEQFGEGLIDFFEDISGLAVDVINLFPGIFNGIANALNNGDPENARKWGYALGVLAAGLLAFKGISDLIPKVAAFVGGIMGVVGIIRNIIGVFEIVSGGFGTLGEAILWVFGPVVKILTGVGSLISGIVLAVTNFFSMWKNGFSWLNEALMIFGTALATIGVIILAPIEGAGIAIAAAIGGIVAAVATIAIAVHDNWDAICEFCTGIPEWFDTNVVQPVVEFFRGLWESVSDFFSELWADICEIWGTVSSWFSDNIVEPIVNFFKGLYTRVSQVFEGLWIIVEAIWIIASDWFNENVIIPLVNFFKGLWTAVSGFFSGLWNDVCTIWSTVSGWFNQNVIIPVTDWFKQLWDDVSGIFSNLWEDIQKVWSVVTGWFNDNIIDPVSKAFETACEAIGEFFDGLWSGIKSGVVSAMNSVIAGIESAINWIVDGINDIISGFNKIVSWAAKVADEDWGGVDLVPRVSLGRISGYASGGYPETGELFLARENGINEMIGRIGSRSAVANNDQITQAITNAVAPAVYEAVTAAMMTGGSRVDQAPVVEVEIKTDSEILYKTVRKGKEKYDRRYHILAEF